MAWCGNGVIGALWAKTQPPHPLYCHLIDVGNVTLALLSTTAFRGIAPRFCAATGCPESLAPAWLAYLTALHDIGKGHPGFESKGPEDLVRPLLDAGLPCLPEPGFRHEAFSASWVLRWLRDEWGWEHSSARTASEAIRGHHGDFRVDDPVPELPAAHAKWEPLRRELAALVRDVFAPGIWQARFIDHSTAGMLLSGLLVLSDWIASNAELFPMRCDGLPPAEYARVSRERATQAVDALDFNSDIPWSTGARFADVWPKIVQPRPVQAKCEDLCRSGLAPGLAIIEAPMGEGKTEAAIYLAARWLADTGRSGLYVALPTAATSNQMHGRIREFLREHGAETAQGVRLVHGMAWLIDGATPSVAPSLEGDEPLESGEALDWFRPKKRSLLAAYGVGTIDQALLSVLHVKHGFLRLFGLTGKVLVVDEVHAYDAYMTEILTLLLRWCRVLRIPVVLLSATLPSDRRAALIRAYNPEVASDELSQRADAYPLVTHVAMDGAEAQFVAVEGSTKRLNIQLERHYGLLNVPDAIARLVAERIRNGGCHCVITNSVKSAQAVYRALKTHLQACGDKETRLMLFHARFCAGQRQAIERRTLELFDKRSLLPHDDPARTQRPGRAILVATQVVEQSLDLDFDEMFSEVAPIDLLLQRAGRLHRHERAVRPTGSQARMHILLPPAGSAPDFGSTERVYERYFLLQTLLAIDGRDTLSLPDDIKPLVEHVYRAPADLAGLPREACEGLLQSWKSLQNRIAREREQAATYLIPDPNPRRFGLAVKPGGAFEENEGNAASYFAAKTRLGEMTSTVMLLEGGQYQSALESQRPPKRAVLQQMMENTVPLPTYWLTDVTPADGFSPPEQAPHWLPGVTVLRTVGRVWRGLLGSSGKEVTIRNDSEFGLMREVEAEEVT